MTSNTYKNMQDVKEELDKELGDDKGHTWYNEDYYIKLCKVCNMRIVNGYAFNTSGWKRIEYINDYVEFKPIVSCDEYVMRKVLF